MRTFGRIVGIVGLLLGFYLLCLGIIGALVALDVLMFAIRDQSSHAGYIKLVLILGAATLGAIVIVARGLFVSTRIRRGKVPGVAVTEQEEPALWRRVRELAAIVGTRPPAEIRLVGEVNAAVFENAYLLGLVPGRRYMLIGVPLLQGLTPAQFDAVIAHELGHYSGAHTRLGALVGRTRGGVLSALNASVAQAAAGWSGVRLPGSRLFARIFAAYAKLVLTVTQAASREQEYAADRVAAGIAGQANAAAALRELPVLDTAYGFYLGKYVSPGLDAGLLPHPHDLLGGFAGLLAEPSRRAELDRVRAEPPQKKVGRYDSHPPVAGRVAAIAALPPDGRPLDASGLRAVALLRDPARWLAAVAAALVGEQGRDKQVVDWDTLATATAQRHAAASFEPLAKAVSLSVGRPAGMSAFLGLVDAGRLGDVLDRLPRSEAAQKAGASERTARVFAMDTLRQCMRGWVLDGLARRGVVHWRHTWSDAGGELQIPREVAQRLEAALDAVVAPVPDTRPLREMLSRTHAPA